MEQVESLSRERYHLTRERDDARFWRDYWRKAMVLASQEGTRM